MIVKRLNLTSVHFLLLYSTNWFKNFWIEVLKIDAFNIVLYSQQSLNS